MTDRPESSDEKRFPFGKNWAQFLRLLNDDRIREAERSLKTMLETDSLEGKRFLDVGCGSGLFSLAARRLGARVYSFDFDADSVACTEELKRRFFPDDPDWTIEQQSVLDQSYLASLGTFDIVYSWGVLHHTGDMWNALDNVTGLVAPRGCLFIALYNDVSTWRFWHFVKKWYCSGAVAKSLVCTVFVPYFFCRLLGKMIVTRRNLFAEYKRRRGMSAYYDWIDWLGGYPYEVANPGEVIDFYRDRGFHLRKLVSTNRLGCNEFVFANAECSNEG